MDLTRSARLTTPLSHEEQGPVTRSIGKQLTNGMFRWSNGHDLFFEGCSFDGDYGCGFFVATFKFLGIVAYVSSGITCTSRHRSINIFG